MAIGKQSSADFQVLLLDGMNLLAAKVKEWTWKTANLLERSEGLGDSWHEHSPTGMRQGTVTQAGAFFDTSTNNIHTALKDATTATRVLAFAPAGNAIGSLFVAYQGVLQSVYEVIASTGKLTKANAQYQVTGAVDEGIIVQDWVTKTANWNTKTDGFPVDYIVDPTRRNIPIASNSIANPTVVTTSAPHGLTTGDIILIAGVAASNPTIDGERTVTVTSATTFTIPVNVTTGGTGGSFVKANSANGAVGYQEVSDFTGFTGFVGKIRDSADNTTFADLITFANVIAGPNAQRVEVTGVIDRYVSFDGNLTGSGSIKAFAGLKRN